MTRADFDTFADRLTAVAGVFGRRMPGDTAEVYFRVLADVELVAILNALERFARTAETGARFPSPRDLRMLAREMASPKRAPTEPELRRIVTATNVALARWEREHGIGSARPTFDQAWRDACGRERVLPTTTDREACWQAYLQSGDPSPSGTGPRMRAELWWAAEVAWRGEAS